MVLSTLAVIAIIQLIVLLIGGVFFLFLHTRFLKKQIRVLRGEAPVDNEITPPSSTEQALTLEPSPDKMDAQLSELKNNQSEQALSEALTLQTEALRNNDVTGDIVELRKMLDEKLLLTANMRKLIEAIEENPDAAISIADQQKSTLLHLEEYIKLSRREAAAVEDKIKHFKEQLIKAKKLLDQKSHAPASTSHQPH